MAASTVLLEGTWVVGGEAAQVKDARVQVTSDMVRAFSYDCGLYL